jgi:hypothetical protein
MVSTVLAEDDGHNRPVIAAFDSSVSTTPAVENQSVLMSGVTIEGTVLDHVAHAVPRWQDVWNRYAVDFGAQWSSGGPAPGFAPGQLRFANDARVEILMPYDVEVNDFLARFMASNGPGPHHLTFKVPDLASALGQLGEAGYEPIGVDLSHPEWMEAFLHPRQGTGVVVQLAQAPGPAFSSPPDDYPTGRRQHRDGRGPVPPASLRWVAHAVVDLNTATALFVDMLGGHVSDQGGLADLRWMDLTWDGPLGLRLVSPTDPTSPTPLGEWLGGRRGRIHHLKLSAEDPEGLPGASPMPASLPGVDGKAGPAAYWVIPPEENAGLRLVVGAE